MNKSYVQQKQSRLAQQAKILKNYLADNGNSDLVQKIKNEITQLLQELRHLVSRRRLRRILGAMAIFFGLSQTAEAQTFAAPVQNPFGLSVPAGVDIRFVETADLDDDGDFDILVGAYGYNPFGRIEYYENTGTNDAPAFGTPSINPFGLTVNTYSPSPVLVDIDDDGDLDLFIGGYYQEITFYQNNGTASAPSFAAPVNNPFNLGPPAVSDYFSFLEAADFDDDGDIDLLMSDAYSNFSYYENNGTAIAPDFNPAVDNPFGLNSNGLRFLSDVGDIDDDGDFDVITSIYGGDFEVFLNNGSTSAPIFNNGNVNPFGLSSVVDFGFSSLVDLDGDGDLDMLVAEYYGNFQYFENTATASEEQIGVKGSMFPIPVDDVLNFDYNIAVDRVEIFNVAGQRLKSALVNNNSIELLDLESGVYMIRSIFENGEVLSYRFVKK